MSGNLIFLLWQLYNKSASTIFAVFWFLHLPLGLQTLLLLLHKSTVLSGILRYLNSCRQTFSLFLQMHMLHPGSIRHGRYFHRQYKTIFRSYCRYQEPPQPNHLLQSLVQPLPLNSFSAINLSSFPKRYKKRPSTVLQ